VLLLFLLFSLVVLLVLLLLGWPQQAEQPLVAVEQPLVAVEQPLVAVEQMDEDAEPLTELTELQCTQWASHPEAEQAEAPEQAAVDKPVEEEAPEEVSGDENRSPVPLEEQPELSHTNEVDFLIKRGHDTNQGWCRSLCYRTVNR
jgi:hypothetical protein